MNSWGECWNPTEAGGRQEHFHHHDSKDDSKNILISDESTPVYWHKYMFSQGRWYRKDDKKRSDFHWGTKWIFGHIQVSQMVDIVKWRLSWIQASSQTPPPSWQPSSRPSTTSACLPIGYEQGTRQQFHQARWLFIFNLPEASFSLDISRTFSISRQGHFQSAWNKIITHPVSTFTRALPTFALWLRLGDNCQPGDESFNEGDTHQGAIDKVKTHVLNCKTNVGTHQNVGGHQDTHEQDQGSTISNQILVTLRQFSDWYKYVTTFFL